MNRFLAFLLIFTQLISSVLYAQGMSTEETIQSLKDTGKVDFTLLPTFHAYKQICQINGVNNLSLLSELDDICKIVVASDLCKDVEKDELLRCENIKSESQVDLWEFIKGCAEGAFDSIKDTLTFLWDVLKWITSFESQKETIDEASEYISMVKLYLHTEFEKAYEKSSSPFRTVKALKKMGGAIGNMLLNIITDMINQEYSQLGCLNFEAKSKVMCKFIGNVFIPLGGGIKLLKYGPGALKKFSNIKKAFDKLPKTKIKIKKKALHVDKGPTVPKGKGPPEGVFSSDKTLKLESKINIKKVTSNVDEVKPVSKVNRTPADVYGSDKTVVRGSSGNIYDTKKMDSRYVGEQDGKYFGTKVEYFTDNKIDKLKVYVKEGKIVDKEGIPLNFENAKYIMTKSGDIVVTDYHAIGKVHHSSLNQGRDVAGAGYIIVERGVIKKLSKKSGHYKPEEFHFNQVINELKFRGADLQNVILDEGL